MASTKETKSAHQVVFYSYPKLIFIWPLMILGPALWPIGAIPSIETGLGWAYLLALFLVILTLGVDLERNYAFVWIVVFGAIFFAVLWLGSSLQVPIFRNIYQFFEGLDIKYSRGFGLGLSILLAPPYIAMIVWSRLQHKWRITHNEFEHYSWGRSDDSLARGAKRVRSTYPDLLELLLCGAGTLIVYSATGRSELRRIPHVPLLFLVRRRINRLMERTAIISDTSDELAAEEADAEAEEEEGRGNIDDMSGGGGSGSSGNEAL
jgi:hypothetical protein